MVRTGGSRGLQANSQLPGDPGQPEAYLRLKWVFILGIAVPVIPTVILTLSAIYWAEILLYTLIWEIPALTALRILGAPVNHETSPPA